MKPIFLTKVEVVLSHMEGWAVDPMTLDYPCPLIRGPESRAMRVTVGNYDTQVMFIGWPPVGGTGITWPHVIIEITSPAEEIASRLKQELLPEYEKLYQQAMKIKCCA